MSDSVSENSATYFAYLSVKEGPRGSLKTVFICNDASDAYGWKVKQQTKDNPENFSDLETKGSTVEDPRTSTDELVEKNSDPIELSESDTTFADQLLSFTSSIKSFYDLIDINQIVRVIFPTFYMDKEFGELRKSLPLVDQEGLLKIYGVPDDRLATLNKKMKKMHHTHEGLASIPANVLMGMVARFDASISALVRFLLLNRREKLSGGERMIPVKEVLAVGSFNELVGKLIDDEIHSLMRGSHSDQIRYIEENFSIEVRKGFERWPQFIEVFERRNLAAHGEGAANSRYDRVCKEHRVPDAHRLGIFEDTNLSDSYLRKSTDLLLEFGILMIWWLWLKNTTDQVDKAYSEINNCTYELITEKRYELSARILESALSRKTDGAPEVIKRMMAINLANCYKKLNDDESYKKAMKLFDWTASSDEFQISVASLCQDYERVCELMPRVIGDDKVGKVGFRDWPVFDWVKEDASVRDKFLEVFGEPLEIAGGAGFEADEADMTSE